LDWYETKSNTLALSIYNWTFVGIIVQIIILTAITDVDMIFVTETIMTLITQMGVVGLMFFPKVIAIRNGDGNV
jgi:hypothetical protein